MPDHPYRFPGMSPFIEAAALNSGHDPNDARSPGFLLIASAKANRIIGHLQSQLGQADGVAEADRPGVYQHAEGIAWQLRAMANAAEAAIQHSKAGHAPKPKADAESKTKDEKPK